jgi:hypothetical protein
MLTIYGHEVMARSELRVGFALNVKVARVAASVLGVFFANRR